MPDLRETQVDLVIWTGSVQQLATRFLLPEGQLLKALRKCARSQKGKLTIDVPVSNLSPLFSALKRKIRLDDDYPPSPECPLSSASAASNSD